MEAAGWDRVKDLVAEALARPAAERDAFLEQQCSSAAMLAEVRTLLRASDEMTTGFLDPLIESPALDDGDLPIGTRIGPYLIVDSLARGGMGHVFLGKDLRLHRQVALKSLLSSRHNSSTERTRVLREARAAAQVNHPGVATIHDILEHAERAFIVMEYVPGESLAAVLRRGRLPVDRVIALGRQLAAGLVAAHEKGVIHRDLKPANIQITPSGDAKILDFGVARTTTAFTTATGSSSADDARGPQPGTRGYMSPEQMLSRHADERSDIFSLGIVLFEMATGERAFEPAGELDLLDAIQRPVRRADAVDARVPRALADVIARALEIDPAGRFQSAAAMAGALTALEQERATNSSSSGMADLATLTRRRRIVTAARAALAVSLALALVPALGYLTTAAFNNTLGRRAPFDRESPAAWVEFGARSLVMPALTVVAILVAIWTVAFAVRLLRLVGPIDRLVQRLARRLSLVISPLSLDEPRVFAQAIVAAGVAILLLIIWSFGDLLLGCLSFVNTSPASNLVPLQPGHLGALYRFTLHAVILGLAAALFHMRRLRAANRSARPGSLAPIIALMALMVFLSEAPYRLLWWNQVERIEYRGQRCYVLGQANDQALVYCPDQPAPRNQVVSLNAPAVRRLGLPAESLFSPPPSQ